jgi:hypothetical protein
MADYGEYFVQLFRLTLRLHLAIRTVEQNTAVLHLPRSPAYLGSYLSNLHLGDRAPFKLTGTPARCCIFFFESGFRSAIWL